MALCKRGMSLDVLTRIAIGRGNGGRSATPVPLPPPCQQTGTARTHVTSVLSLLGPASDEVLDGGLEGSQGRHETLVGGRKNGVRTVGAVQHFVQLGELRVEGAGSMRSCCQSSATDNVEGSWCNPTPSLPHAPHLQDGSEVGELGDSLRKSQGGGRLGRRCVWQLMGPWCGVSRMFLRHAPIVSPGCWAYAGV